MIARGLGSDAAATFLGQVLGDHRGPYLERDRSIDATPATHLERTLRPVDPDGSLLAAAVREGELLAALDEERETG